MNRALWTLAVLLSHWRRHPTQLATLLIGLISATALWSGVQALNQQARNAYDRAAATFGGARSLGATSGALEVGRPADFFPVNLFDPSIAGAEPGALLNNLVFSLERQWKEAEEIADIADGTLGTSTEIENELRRLKNRGGDQPSG